MVVMGLLAPGVVAVGLAYACTPQANIHTDTSGVAGTRVLVSGDEFAPAGRVDIHWGSTTGPVLATATGPSFRTSVTIPEAPPGVYTIVALGLDAANAVAGEGRQAFEVIGAEPAASPSSSAPAGDAGAAATPSTQAAEPAAAAGAQPSVSPPPDGVTGKTRTPSTSRTPVRGASPSKSTAPSRPAHTPAAQPRAGARATAASPVSSNPPVVRAQDGRAVFGGSVAPLAARRSAHAGRSAKEPATASPQRPRPAAQPSVARSPSLSPSAADPRMAQPSSPGSTLMLGIGLLGVGMVALFAGALVAGVRRRRAPATRTHDPRH
jgi:hypothetical protein